MTNLPSEDDAFAKEKPHHACHYFSASFKIFKYFWH